MMSFWTFVSLSWVQVLVQVCEGQREGQSVRVRGKVSGWKVKRKVNSLKVGTKVKRCEGH